MSPHFDFAGVDLEQSLARLNIELARETRHAYETWGDYHSNKPADINERKARQSEIDTIEKKIATLETERTLVERALKYERLANESDETVARSPGIEATIDELNTTVARQIDEAVAAADIGDHKAPAREKVTRRPARNGRRRHATATA